MVFHIVNLFYEVICFLIVVTIFNLNKANACKSAAVFNFIQVIAHNNNRIGNIVGSNIFNILFVIGVSAAIIPVPFANGFRFDTIVAALAAVLLLICSLKDRKLKRLSGIIMLLAYAVYFVVIL